MAITEFGPNIDIPFLVAGEDLTDKEGLIVTQNSDNEVILPTAVTDVPLGVLIEGDIEGRSVTVRVFGVCPVIVKGQYAVPAVIGINGTDGKAKKLTAGSEETTYVVGQLLEASDTDGDTISALINCMAPALGMVTDGA
jgi:hypothetical protein